MSTNSEQEVSDSKLVVFPWQYSSLYFLADPRLGFQESSMVYSEQIASLLHSPQPLGRVGSFLFYGAESLPLILSRLQPCAAKGLSSNLQHMLMIRKFRKHSVVCLMKVIQFY